jgi:hypothetical protein
MYCSFLFFYLSLEKFKEALPTKNVFRFCDCHACVFCFVRPYFRSDVQLVLCSWWSPQV